MKRKQLKKRNVDNFKKTGFSKLDILISLTIFASVVFLIAGGAIIFINTPLYGQLRTQIQKPLYEQPIITLINAERQKEHLKPLTENYLLDQSALLKGKDMIKNNYFAHVSPSGVNYSTFPLLVKYQWIHFGENLGINFTDDKKLFTAWMASPLHRKNMLDPDYTEAGFARVGKYTILHLGAR